jgi:hypothetical protein
MKIYLISGLGYDCRIFQNIDFDNFKVEYINWIEPLLGESLHDYSIRLFENMKYHSVKNMPRLGKYGQIR